jgi:hypothetical protein
MNKIIILLLIFIILFISYVYNKKQEEKFSEGNSNLENIIHFIDKNYLKITDEGEIAVQKSDTELLPITISNGSVKIGNNYNFNPNGDIKIISSENQNINIEDFIYGTDGSKQGMFNIGIDKNNNIISGSRKINSEETNLFNIIDNKNYFKVTRIILKKEPTPTKYPYNILNSLVTYPLHIAGIKFKDINDKDINYSNYETKFNNMTQTKTTKNSIFSTGSTTHTGAELTNINLYNESNKDNFTGIGLDASGTQSYEFIFTQPTIVKTISITNRKDSHQSALLYSTLFLYGKDGNNKEILLKTISLNNTDKNPHYEPGKFFSENMNTPLTINLYP